MHRWARTTLTLTVLAMLLAGPGPAGAGGEPCQKSGNALVIAFPTPGGLVELHVGTNGELVVTLNGQPLDCDGATNQDTDVIVVTGGTGNDTLLLDQSGPGGELDRSTRVQVGLGDNNRNTMAIRGTPQRDVIQVGTLRTNGDMIDVIDRNGDGVPDIDLQDVDRFVRRVSNGNDIVTGRPRSGPKSFASGGATMGPARIPLTLQGGKGNDRLTGGNANDKLVGGTGNDKLKGGKGKDGLNGGKGTNDRCNGGPGKDRERGCD